MIRRSLYHALFSIMLLFHIVAEAQQPCTFNLPYSQNFNNSYALDNGWVNTNLDTTLIFKENCWTQYTYRACNRWPFISYLPHHEQNNYALRLISDHPIEGNDRLEYTYVVSPAFLDVPIVLSFDYCNVIISQELDSAGLWIDLTSEHIGILQVGYTTDTAHPESSYHPIIDIVMDPADGATDIMRHFRLDLRSVYSSLPNMKQIAFKMLTDMTGVKYSNIYIDNFRVSQEMDTIKYRDTICPGQPYNGYGFSIDSTQTANAGLYTFDREAMESYGMVHYRLQLLVIEPTTTHVDTSLALGETLQFLDSTIVETGDYTFLLTSSIGCDSTVVLHVSRADVSLVASSQQVCPGEEIVLTSSGILTPHWYSIPLDPSLQSQQGQQTVTVHPMEDIVYQILDEMGTLLSSITVKMESCEGLWFPNVFFPNAETNNRFLIQTSLPVESFEMTIYTRTGMLVWHSEDINQMWDGTRDGTPVPQGAYVYHWRLKSNNRVRSGLGTLTLLR